MSLAERITGAITAHSTIVLLALLLVTAMIGAGATMIDDDSSLEQFESESDEARALEYIDENFTREGEENTTTVQLIVRGNGDNVLARESLLESLRFQQEIRDTESINETLAEENAMLGVENVIATTIIRERQGEELGERAAELEARADRLNETADGLRDALNRTRELEGQYVQLNASYERGEINDSEYQRRSTELDTSFDAVYENATADLDENQSERFARAMTQVRSLVREQASLDRQYERGDLSEDEYERRSADVEAEFETTYRNGTVGVLDEEYEQLQADFDQLEAEQRALQSPEQPPLDEQIEALENADDEEFEAALERTLSGGGGPGGDIGLRLMSSSYEPGSTSAEARMIVLRQSTEAGEFQGPGTVDEAIVDRQLELRDMATDRDQEYLVFGFGVISDEMDRSMTDSLLIVAPMALLLVFVTLLIAYRDPLDIVLGLAGIFAVLLWTFGFMGWAGIAFNQLFVAVPVLLIGLSIDYAIHVFMRHREHRGAPGAPDERTGSGAPREQRENGAVDDTVRGSMTIALAGVGVALLWVTATTVIGFLSNLVSPIQPIREFGVVSSVGIVAAMIVFGAMIPAAKVELDSFLEARGYDRRKRAFGTGGGSFSGVLQVGSTAARRAPLVLLFVVLLVTAGGVYGASQVDTSFDQEDFLADDPPAWSKSLPEPFKPGEYRAKSDLEYVNENFRREDAQAQILVRGDVTDGETLNRLAAAENDSANSDVVFTLAGGDADVRSPLSVMRDAAAENESFNATFNLADTDGDGVPDQNVEGLYDQLYEVDEEAARDVVYRTEDGEYEAVRLVVSIRGDAGSGETTEEMRAIAGNIDDDGTDDRWSAIATGDVVVSYIVEQDLLDTVLESLMITLVAVFLFLTAAYWLTGGSATLGTVTLLPVAFAVSWILGTMYLIGMPFNVLTGMITSLTIGLGVAYSIHISARYQLELERQGSVWAAMDTTVTGTGGALLGSAATTVGGFGTLAFAILPVLKQFGLITAMTIVYAFLASVLVLPSLLVLWTRYFGPDVSFEPTPTDAARPASDGGRPDDGGDDR